MLSASTAPLAAESKICFTKSEADKIYTEIKFGQTTNDKLNLCMKSYSTASYLNIIDKKQINGLEQDKVDLRNVSNEFKKKYEETAQKLVETEANIPSRTTWFGLGVGATVIFTLLLSFLVKK